MTNISNHKSTTLTNKSLSIPLLYHNQIFKLRQMAIATIVDYVSNNPFINVKKIKLMVLRKHKIHINKNYTFKITKIISLPLKRHKNINILMKLKN